MTWLSVWTRAVVVTAGRRAGGAWIGAAVIGAVVFGPTGLQPHDVTTIAWHEPVFAAVLCLTWILVFLPTARVLVRGDAASYLRSLPSPRVTPLLVALAALVVLQLPWFALWLLGDGVRGLAVVATTTFGVVGLARWRAGVPRTPWPTWPSPLVALRAIHVRAMRRRASDALVRGVGLAILGGLFAGLFVRNNQLADASAATIASAVIGIALVPAQVGPLLALVEAHRQAGWLASSLGVSPALRTLALAQAIALIYLGSSLLSALASLVLIGTDMSTAAWIVGTSSVVALGATLAMTRVLVTVEYKATVSSRTVAGAIAVASIGGLMLGLFGAVLGALALVVIGATAVGTAST